MTRKWYVTIRHHKMHPHTKFGIPISNNKRYALDTIILKPRSEVKVTVTRKWYATLRHPKMHPLNNFGIPTSKNMRCAPDTKRDVPILLPKVLWWLKNLTLKEKPPFCLIFLKKKIFGFWPQTPLVKCTY